jgi:hypothetical protein
MVMQFLAPVCDLHDASPPCAFFVPDQPLLALIHLKGHETKYIRIGPIRYLR